MPAARRLFLPEILLAGGRVFQGVGLLVDAQGLVEDFCTPQAIPQETEVVSLRGKILLPGMANAHSHTFQRLFRGRAESRAAGGDSFWTWREQMYRAAAFVSPEDLYDVARATFLEMAAAGVTVVGEFHYLHRDQHGRPYDDPNLLSKQVISAARSVGIRICLLRSAYLRAGFERPPHGGQQRFYEQPQDYLRNLEELRAACQPLDQVTVGAAPHSIRAVPLDQIREIADHAKHQGALPLHLHISEQIAENTACVAEYGRTPVELMEEQGILSSAATLIHAIHLTEGEFRHVARSGASICSCPTTERNLGDGIFPADLAARLGIPVAIGSDSQAQIDILEDARQLEYHLRLRDEHRSILDGWAASQTGSEQGIGTSLFRSASSNGYRALGLAGGTLAKGEAADFFTVDWNDLSILGLSGLGLSSLTESSFGNSILGGSTYWGPDASIPQSKATQSETTHREGSESLAAQVVFALSKSAIHDVAVQGQLILEDGRHREGDEIRSRYKSVQLRYVQNTSGI